MFQNGYTALHIAVEAIKPNMVESLLGHGANLTIQGKFRILLSFFRNGILETRYMI